MNFLNIIFKNVKNKFGSYLIYFVSTLFSVLIFNMFCSIYYNPTFQSFRFGAGKMSVLFKGVAVIVFMFATIFVLYSNDYFIKTRKKEIAIYSILGMKKTQIATLMFGETFFIGMLATCCGTVIGSLSSTYFTSLLMKFMGAGTNVVFAVDIRAIIVTIIAFVILFVISGVRSYHTIYKYKLIDLLSASKQGEALPDYSIVAGIISIVLIAIGYVIAVTLKMDVGGFKLLLPSFGVLILVCTGSYILFRNFMPLLLVFIRHRKSIYFKPANIISISQISFRVKANAKMLCVVSILCATTVTMISGAYSLYHGLEDSIDFYAPYSQLCKGITDDQFTEIKGLVNDIGEVSITHDDKIEILNGSVQDSVYQPNEKAKVGDMADSYVISESTYLRIIDHTDAQKGENGNLKTTFTGGLSDDSCYFIDSNSKSDYCKDMVGTDLALKVNNSAISYHVTDVSIHKYLGLIYNSRKATVVVSDSTFEKYKEKASDEQLQTFYGLMYDKEMNSEATVDAINEMLGCNTGSNSKVRTISYIHYYKDNFSIYGSYVFIGLFIGVLFILAVGSVLYYKLIIEAQEEAPRYLILRKCGMKKNEIRASVRKQLGMVYGAPLALGLLHTVFALITYNHALDIMGQETPTLRNAAIVVLIYVVIYGLFYLLSNWNYNKIVLRRR